MDDVTSRKHYLKRTSPKEEPFIGVCVLCGKPGLTFADMRKECSNIRGLSEEEEEADR